MREPSGKIKARLEIRFCLIHLRPSNLVMGVLVPTRSIYHISLVDLLLVVDTFNPTSYYFLNKPQIDKEAKLYLFQ